jgi:hypothetical protein
LWSLYLSTTHLSPLTAYSQKWPDGDNEKAPTVRGSWGSFYLVEKVIISRDGTQYVPTVTLSPEKTRSYTSAISRPCLPPVVRFPPDLFMATFGFVHVLERDIYSIT